VIAVLSLNGKQMHVILQSPENATFRTLKPRREFIRSPLVGNVNDMPNDGVSVLSVDAPLGSVTIAVIFSPVWGESGEFPLPPVVPLGEWTLASH
jgi:hypothetical protein